MSIIFRSLAFGNQSVYFYISGLIIPARCRQTGYPATDDFRVTNVFVEIRLANGTLLEQGNAVIGTNTVDWNYTITQANAALAGTIIKATATDVPGNEGTLEITL